MTLLPALALLALPQTYTDEQRGFSLEVPEGWVSAPREVDANQWALTLAPEGGDGATGLTLAVSALGAGEGVEALLERSRTLMAANPDVYTEWSQREGWLGELAGPGLSVVYESALGALRIEAELVASDGYGYTLQQHAPLAEFEGRAEELLGIAQSFRLLEASPAGLEARRLAELAARCGSEVSWATDWASAAERARAEDRLVLVVVFELGGFDIQDTPRNLLFSDPDVIALVEQRYVPLAYRKGMGSPLDASYGLGPSTFGQGLLIARPDGEVLAETEQSSRPEVALPFLIDAVGHLPETALDPDGDPIEAAGRLVERGELQRALELLGELESPEAEPALRARAEELALRARIARLEGRGEQALELLEAALAASAEPPAELQLELAGLWMRAGRVEQAAELLQRAADDAPDPELRARARLMAGVTDLQLAGPERARARWVELALEQPESPSAWKAASMARSQFLELGLKPNLGWMAPAVREELLARPGRRNADAAPGAEAAAADALRWLLEHQRPDGSWVSASEAGSAARDGSDPFVDAIAAIGLRALLRYRDAAGAEAAAGRALDYLLATVAARAAGSGESWFMDYQPWADACLLEGLAAARAAGLGDPAALAAAVEEVLADAAARQVADGGWSYYVTADLDASTGAPSRSITFTTAAVLSGLRSAAAAGFDVPATLLDPPAALLERLRGEDGVFPYFASDPGAPAGVAGDARGEVGRGPVCELSLVDDTPAGRARLAGALERFLDQAHLFAAEQGKVLMHAGPQGQGCHYLLFDLGHAALAQERLPADRETRARLTALILDCAQADGSFLDTPILGRPFGTAMGLLALDALEGAGS